jgi:CHASE2 domain-containing sensor protein
VFSVFLLVAAWNLSVESKTLPQLLQRRGTLWETLAEVRNVNLHIQLRFYQLLTSMRAIKMQPGAIRFVYVDDDVHWTNFYGDMPTNRGLLAKLVRNASQPTTKAEAIGLDIELLAPRNFPAGSDAEERANDNADLKNALEFASSHGVPVVLTTMYYVDDAKRNVRLPNIYADEELPLQKEDGSCPEALLGSSQLDKARGRYSYPRCISFGYINAPDDKRQIALSVPLFDPASKKTKTYESFALALAKAVEGWPPAINEYEPFKDAQNDNKAIFGSFIPESSFGEVNAFELADGHADAEKKCASKILLIGGNWHTMQGYGPPVDAHLSPVGVISGVAFHANYVASLLQRQFATEVPAYAGIFIDLVIGLVIYIAFEAAEGWMKVAGLGAVALMPPLIAYFFLVTTNRYLDFLLPVELYLLHITYEITENYWMNHRSVRREALASE